MADRRLPANAATTRIPNVGNRVAGGLFLFIAAGNIVIQTVEHGWNGVLIVVVALSVVFGVRLCLTGVAITSVGFTSRDVFLTRHLPWSEAVAFDKEVFRVRVLRTNGRWQRVQIYGALPSSGAPLLDALRTAKAASMPNAADG